MGMIVSINKRWRLEEEVDRLIYDAMNVMYHYCFNANSQLILLTILVASQKATPQQIMIRHTSADGSLNRRELDNNKEMRSTKSMQSLGNSGQRASSEVNVVLWRMVVEKKYKRMHRLFIFIFCLMSLSSFI